ncbi:MAG TPA: beta-Ala-His dipeptidase [Rectinemataceae bacterium]|nr:beta-Ala-His dipeptidase [Rectinemataceae bacterium]
MSHAFDPSELEERELWEAFLEICEIPHPSHGEEALALWALERARRLGLSARRDAIGNVIIRKAARPGREAAPGVILQAHLDMVPQKAVGLEHDFAKDPIRPRLDPEDPAWLKARGTTLGADNGIGLAAGICLLGDRDLDHGPLELLLTVNEEDGMTGAEGLERGSLSGRFLLNLDSEREEELCVGSAGGQRLTFSFSETALPVSAGLVWLSIEVSGLRGGHSGGEIQLGRANAIRLLLGLLAAEAGSGLRLASISGGSLPNAIPREASALIGVAADELAGLRSRIEARVARAAADFHAADPGLRVQLDEATPPRAALDTQSSIRILHALSIMPDGLRTMLEGVPDVARLSSNLGALGTRLEAANGVEGAKLLISGRSLVRGAFDDEKAGLLASIRASLEAGGAEVIFEAPRSAWPPDLSSHLLALAREVWDESLGHEVSVRATHGGLECNLFRPAFSEWDMISIGPTIRFPHSPDEAVEIASVGRFYRRTRQLIERLARWSDPRRA